MDKCIIVPIELPSKGQHSCKIVPLRNQYHGNFQRPTKGFYLFAQNLSSYQYHDSTDYYLDVSNRRRGGVSEVGGQPEIYDVAIHPSPFTPKSIKEGFISVVVEKTMNDIETYKKMIAQMKKDGKITEEEHKEMNVEICDVGDQIKRKYDIWPNS